MNLLKFVFSVGSLMLWFGSLSVSAQTLTCDSLLKRAEELGKQQDLMHLAGLVEKVETACKEQYTVRSKQYADAISMHGFLYHLFGNDKESLDTLLKVRELYNLLQMPYDDEDYGNLQSNLAQSYMGLGNMRSAKIHNDSAIAIAFKLHGKKSSSYGYRLVNQGTIFFKKTNPNLDSAELCYQAGIRVLRMVKDSSFTLVGLNALSALLQTQGKNKEALHTLEEAYQIAKRKYGEDNLLTAVIIADIGVILSDMGRYYEANKQLDLAIHNFEKAGFTSHPFYQMVLTNQAGINAELGKYDEATRLLVKSSRYPLSASNAVDSASYYGVLALIAESIGDELEAVQELLRAKEIFEKADQKTDFHYTPVLSNLGAIYGEMGNYTEAVRLFDEAIELTKRSSKEPNPKFVQLFNNAAMAWYKLGHYEKANQLLSEALNIACRGPKKNQYLADLYQTFGVIKLYANELQQSRVYLAKSRHLFAKSVTPENNNYCSARIFSALTESLVGSSRRAEKWYKTTLHYLRKGHSEKTLTYIQCLTQYGRFRSTQDDSIGALALFKEAQVRLLDYLNASFTFLSENGKERFLQVNESDLCNPQMFAYRRGRGMPEAAGLVYDNELVTKGLLLYSVQSVGAAIKASGDTALIRLFDYWKNIKQLLARQFSQPLQDRLVRQNILDSLVHVADTVEATLTLRSAAFQFARTAVNWQLVRDSLQAGEAAVEFARFQVHDQLLNLDSAFYAAIVLRPGDRYPHFIPLFNEQLLLDHLGTAEDLTNLQERIGVIYLGNGETPLYQLIWKPLDTLLTGVKTVYYAPAGLLHRLSFPLISANQPLLQRYDLRMVGSTREVALGRKPVTAASIQSALLCGGIQYDADSLCLVQNKPRRKPDLFDLPGDEHASLALRGGCSTGPIPSLPGTLTETDRLYVRLNARFSTRLLLGCAANEAEIKALGKNTPAPGILHIATHGFFCDMPSVKAAADQLPLFRTGLLLAGAGRTYAGEQPLEGMDDGILYAYEVADLNLTGTKLVVLSACETALGEIRGGEGVYGLARAFRLAGAEHVMMSLWQINDAQTVRFMETFYDKWLGGQDIHDAFRDTQRELLRAGVGPDVWGAFVLL